MQCSFNSTTSISMSYRQIQRDSTVTVVRTTHEEITVIIYSVVQ